MGGAGGSGYEIGAVLTCHSPSLAMNFPHGLGRGIYQLRFRKERITLVSDCIMRSQHKGMTTHAWVEKDEYLAGWRASGMAFRLTLGLGAWSTDQGRKGCDGGCRVLTM